MGIMSKEEISKRMSMISVLAMIAVMYIHCNCVATLSSPAKWNLFFQEAWSRMGTAWAVPFFFMQAGFWAQSAKIGGGGYKLLFLKKIRGLLIPYLSWAVIGMLIGLPLYLFNNHVNHVPMFSRTVFDAPSWIQVVFKLFGVINNGPAGNLALWFVRDLMFVFLLFPLLKMIAGRSKMALLVLGTLGIALGYDAAIPFLSVKVASFGFFILGMSVADWNLGGVRFSKTGWFAGAAVYLAFILLGASIKVGCLSIPAFANISAVVLPIAGIVFWFGLYDNCRGVHWRFPNGLHKTFWIYCMHGSIIGYWTSGVFFVFGKSDVVSISMALSAPIPTAVVCVSAFYLCNRFLPRTTVVISGGR